LALIANEPKDEPTQRQSVFSKMVTWVLWRGK
jgi:hypothetical protein